RFGAGCEGIMFNRVKQKKDEYIMQEYIEGVDASVSLFSNGAESMAVSLNKQKIIQTGNYLNYCGGVVPLKHVLRDEAFQLAEKAVDAIGGLKGCIGVDMILSDKPYVVEINPRVTTSMTALQQAADFNVAYRSLKAYQGFMPDKPRFNKVIEYNITDKGITYSSQAI
ncbi:MAG: ATP-utilizing protein, partial [Candidatus Altiarchaeales archaeon ex4484_96]